MKRLAAAAAVLVLSVLLGACGSSSSNGAAKTTCSYPTDSSAPAARHVTLPPSTPTNPGTVSFTMTTSVGKLSGSLDGTHAPCTVSSFTSLAKQHYFDNTPCHRLTTTAGLYVLQCGDPTGTGTGGPGYTIPDELSGHETYQAGTIAMANTGQPNSGGSQFFLVYRDSRLPPQYTVFGHLTPASVALLGKVAKKGSDNAYGPGDGHPNEKVTITGVTTG
jgi:peptidyl-prolyl cis-trans isomerase B (cyclophilin B)